MDSCFVLVLTLFTSMGLYLMGRGRLHLSPGGMHAAAGLLLAWLGMTAALFAGNVLVGMVVAHVVRTFTPVFVSLYHTNDLILLALSSFQALLFQFWWMMRQRPAAS